MGGCSSECVFCEIIHHRTRELIFENETIAIFNDRSPLGRIHLQCVPKEHLKNINALNASHIELVETMQREAINYILSIDSEVTKRDVKLGFHIPPFISVGHLHMHCLVPPYNNKCLKCLKVDVIFRSADAVLEKLKSMKTEGLASNTV